MMVLGLETSCDETAAALVEDGRWVRSNVIASQFDLHAPFGGVVPELAARAHAERITGVIEAAFGEAGLSPGEVGGIAVVSRPGLISALLVGVNAAKALALAWEVPVVGVDHIEAHLYALLLAGMAEEPHVALVVSGGHTCLYHVRPGWPPEVLGATTDDAAGEAFDKVAKLLGLAYPGGPALEKAAGGGDPQAVRLPRGRLEPADDLDFSFSGLKTAVLYHLRGGQSPPSPAPGRATGTWIGRELSSREVADVAASFQETICEVLVEKLVRAARQAKARRVAVCGGVACNGRLRAMLAERARREELSCFWPPPSLCVDNGAMVAGLGFRLLSAGQDDGLELDAVPTPLRAPVGR